MTRQELLDQKILNREQIILSRDCNTIKLLNFVLIVLCLLTISSLLYFYKINKTGIALSAVFSLLYLSFYYNIKQYASASIKGEMLLLKNIKNENFITELRSIKSIRSFTLFRMNYTSITFKLDGGCHTAKIIKKLENDDIENEKIINSILKKAG